MYQIPTGFCAYPAQPPSLAETIRDAAERLNQTKNVYLKTWEDLKIGGRVLIDSICREIESANLFLADLSGLNANVLYELGYAIARGKRIWITLDETVGSNKQAFQEFKLLSTVGYRSSINTDQMTSHFWQDSPHTNLEASLLTEALQPHLAPTRESSVIFLKPNHATNATNAVLKRLNGSPLSLVIDDPQEAPTQTLIWYAQHAWDSRAVICQLERTDRAGAHLRNARMAFVAGLAHGFEKSVLLLAEGDYLAPIDYRDRLRTYQTASAAGSHVENWLTVVESEWQNAREGREKNRAERVASLKLVTELKNVQLGEYVAENEEDALRDAYFVETASYNEALRGEAHSLLFVGAKGAGKTANFVKLQSVLTADARNTVCSICPAFVELASLLSVLKRFVERDRRSYVIEGLWRALLYMELAATLKGRVSLLPLQARTPEQEEFLRFCDANAELVADDFAVRLERTIQGLSTEEVEAAAGLSIEQFREAIGRRLYGDLLPSMRRALGAALPSQGSVVILVDNLDKAWDREMDLAELAEFLLGALRAANKLANELQEASADSKRRKSKIIVFLRADIYDRIRRVAREPDKLRATWLEWNDRSLLVRLLQERLTASQGEDSDPEQLWKTFFCPFVGGETTPDYLVAQSLPKPRDLLFLTKAALAEAINHGHGRVDAQDVLQAAKRYSEFAYEVLRIEDASSERPVVETLIMLAGRPFLLPESAIRDAIVHGVGAESPPSEGALGDAMRRLVLLGFLEVEVGPSTFRSAEREIELDKVLTMARRHAAERGGEVRYRVHRAYRPYLELQEPS
ncbi:MAG TPA: hypothetical protein VHE30_21235 [Polyangiaceae bacterium]|nr:hypothetical protein [Polyangiaceae bacterium]